MRDRRGCINKAAERYRILKAFLEIWAMAGHCAGFWFWKNAIQLWLVIFSRCTVRTVSPSSCFHYDCENMDRMLRVAAIEHRVPLMVHWRSRKRLSSQTYQKRCLLQDIIAYWKYSWHLRQVYSDCSKVFGGHFNPVQEWIPSRSPLLQYHWPCPFVFVPNEAGDDFHFRRCWRISISSRCHGIRLKWKMRIIK